MSDVIKRLVEAALDGENPHPRRRSSACSCSNGDADSCPGAVNCPFSVHYDEGNLLRTEERRRLADGA